MWGSDTAADVGPTFGGMGSLDCHDVHVTEDSSEPLEVVRVGGLPGDTFASMKRLLLGALLGVVACGKTPSPAPAPSEAALPVAASSEPQAPAGPPGDVTDADQVIARLRPRFRSCYQDGLSEDPTMEGRVVIAARVEATGSVGSTEVRTRTGRLSDPVVACMSLAIRNAAFARPTSGHATTLMIPISFVASATASAPLSEEEQGVKHAFTTSCANTLRRRGATSDATTAKQCECSWGVLRRTFTPTEINNAKLSEDPRYAAVQAEATKVCVPGAK